MTFSEISEQVRALGFGLSYEASRRAWLVMRGFQVLHEAEDARDALQFCRAWKAYVR